LSKAARTLSPDFFGIQGNAQRSPTQLVTQYRINRLTGNKPTHDVKMESCGSLVNNELLEVEHLFWWLRAGQSIKQKE